MRSKFVESAEKGQGYCQHRLPQGPPPEIKSQAHGCQMADPQRSRPGDQGGIEHPPAEPPDRTAGPRARSISGAAAAAPAADRSPPQGPDRPPRPRARPGPPPVPAAPSAEEPGEEAALGAGVLIGHRFHGTVHMDLAAVELSSFKWSPWPRMTRSPGWCEGPPFARQSSLPR